MSVAFVRFSDAIARTRPTEANRSILGRTHLRTPSRGPFSAAFSWPGERHTGPGTIFCAAADAGERRGVCHQNSGDRSSQWELVEGVDRSRQRRTVCADDTNGKGRRYTPILSWWGDGETARGRVPLILVVPRPCRWRVWHLVV
ncbi:hypothetical protein PUN28_004880 [Cardiocondyla obscurior]|uniref:Uncharacterized protein n=1 Tax=Cardiocondyla obscurior TaxID=286306 RepID=A0AAW2GER7_9HYME